MIDPQSRKNGSVARRSFSNKAFGTEPSTSRIAEYLRLAQQWVPYGGVPEEEIFVRFGVTKADFDDAVSVAYRLAGEDADRPCPDSHRR